ncbi:MAG: ATP synthase F0 subunit B, partial [Thermodesulfobacteriota bacterium]
MLTLDLTTIYQIIGFFVLLIILQRLLFRPLLKAMEERESSTRGTVQKAEEIESEIKEGLAAYEKKLLEARLKGSEVRAKLKEEALAEEKRLLEDAGREASTELTLMRDKISGEKSSAIKELTAETKSISRNIAGKLLERKLAVILLTGFLTSLPLISMAAEHGEEHGGSGLGLWKIINFILLVIGIYLVWTKIINPALDKRSAGIKKALDDAARMKEEAEKAALLYREKLAALDSRLASIAEELRLEGEAEKERLIKEALAGAARLKEQAKATAEQEIKKARLEIRGEVAELAVKMARELLEKELRPED